MNWLKTVAAAALIQAAALLPAHAGENLNAIKSAGVFKIGTEGTYAPFTYHDESGKLVGFDVEIGEAVAAKLGVKAEFIEGKWDGLIAGLDAKRYDTVINQVGITETRKQKYDFSEPYIASKAVLIARDGDDSIKSFADLIAFYLDTHFKLVASDKENARLHEQFRAGGQCWPRSDCPRRPDGDAGRERLERCGQPAIDLHVGIRVATSRKHRRPERFD